MATVSVTMCRLAVRVIRCSIRRELVTDALHGPRAEVVVSLRGPTPTGLARSMAIVAAAPAVEGLVLVPDALVDLETPLWEAAPFSAMLLGRSDIDDVALPTR